VTLLSMGSRVPEFAPFCDIIAIEPQPVPALPLEMVAEDLGAAQAAARSGQAVWASIQAVGRAWLMAGGGVEGDEAGRPPTPGEHRAMTMLALAHGAAGLLHHGLYFSAAPDREEYYLPRDAPELWESMKETNRMVAQLADAAAHGVYRGCEVTGQVHAGAWDLDGRTVVLAANARTSAALTTFAVPSPTPERLFRIDGGDEAPRTESGRYADDIPPLGARIYVSERPGTANGGSGESG
jgi:hypothetical protein